MTEYSIEEHNHISAAWAAATAARASKLCRFSVATGKQILEEVGFSSQFTVRDLPQPDALDKQHTLWRTKAKQKARQEGLKNFTDGIAAKLINGYLKGRFVTGGFHEDVRVKDLHPPVDALLLEALAKADSAAGNEERAQKWHNFHQKRWSKFDSATYQAVIDLMRASLPVGEPLWKIEKYWRGYQ